jgi:hypothetical protein
LVTAGVFFCAVAAQGQDQPSLGDVARQARLQKQQKDADASKDAASSAPGKDASPKDAPVKDSQQNASPKDTAAKGTQPTKVKRVVTNDEIPEHAGPVRTLPASQVQNASVPQQDADTGPPAEYWKSQIQAAKNNINSLESQIASLSDSIQYAGGNCVANCVQWNERQQQKQQQVEVMKQQLEQSRKQLEDLQDMARKQGFGSSVYDP